MKGIVFTEFLDMVEQKFGLSTVDEIISSSNLPSGGAYTAVGTYSHSEMVTLVTNLSSTSGVSVDKLLFTYGEHLFSRFSQGYGHFFKGVSSAFDFLGNLESYIHVEVLKLYPDAQLPKFEINKVSDNTLEMIYLSERAMSDFAAGLIEGCLKHFNEKDTITVIKEGLSDNGTKVRFLLIKQ